MTVTITKPRLLRGEAYVAGRTPPFPTVFFLDGFQMFSTYYKDYADFLGSWGYVIVQYDLPAMTITTDKLELKYLDPLLDWLQDENSNAGSFVHGLIDMERIATAGHSRGGKLATFHLIENPRVKTAYLIDPVDNDKRFAPESEDNPSAVKALAASAQVAGIVGSGEVGSCNPEGENYEDFWGAVEPGSWLTVISKCTHPQFLKAPPLAQSVFDMLCGKGKTSNKNVIEATRPGLVAWMEHSLRASQMEEAKFEKGSDESVQDDESFLDGFFRWVKQMEEKDVFTFNVKSSDSNIEHASIAQPAAYSTAVAVV